MKRSKKNDLGVYNELQRAIDGDVLADEVSRQMLSTDGSIFSVTPACVVYPRNSRDVSQTVLFAKERGLSVHARGAGSGLCGSSLGAGIIIDFTKYMNRLLLLDREKKIFVCEPGYRLGQLEVEAKKMGLFFPPDPSSGEYASFGGMYGTNASGAHSVKYGNVSDYILDARVVLSNGEAVDLSAIGETPPEKLPENLRSLLRMYEDNAQKIEAGYPDVRYNVAGYNLRGLVQDGRLCLEKLFAGAEGTLGVATRLTFRLIDKPAHDSLVVAFFDDIVSSAKAVEKILPLGPSGIEIMDKSLLNLARRSDKSLREKIPGDVDNVLLIEIDCQRAEKCREMAESVMELLKKDNLTHNAHLAISASEKEKFWAVRKAAVPILYKLKGKKKILALIEDAVVPTNRLKEYFKGIYDILNGNGVDFVLYGHIAKGLMHTRPLLNLTDKKDVAMLKVLADEVFSLVNSLGGSVSGEHGDGRLRSAYIKRAYPDIHPLFLETKRLLDEDTRFNPEIKTKDDPEQMTRLLRYGGNYASQDTEQTILRWPEGFTNEAEKCHGCSKCTTVTTATRMCPIYKFTRDEAASPKAKANILRGLISGALKERSLYESEFQKVIKNCVNCGSCHKECPSNVNIPKLAMEARSRYAKKYGAPLEDHLMTGVEMAGRYTRRVSGLVEPVAGIKMARKAAELFTGLSARRDFIPFPPRSLFDRVNPVEGKGAIRVLYFSGCYAGYIRPEIGEAAIKVLGKLGMAVYTPDQNCCGLPMLSKGMAKEAKNKIRQNIGKWHNLLAKADHLVVTCSSCGLSLMKEWSYLSRGPETDMIKDKIIHISTLVNRYSEKLPLSPQSGKVAYHYPCHLKIQENPDSSVTMLSRIPGMEVTDIGAHCCGMAGSWGMAEKNYSLSKKIGGLMIKGLNSPEVNLGATDCPTCRIQMEQFGSKPVLHPVEIIARSLQ